MPHGPLGSFSYQIARPAQPWLALPRQLGKEVDLKWIEEFVFGLRDLSPALGLLPNRILLWDHYLRMLVNEFC